MSKVYSATAFSFAAGALLLAYAFSPLNAPPGVLYIGDSMIARWPTGPDIVNAGRGGDTSGEVLYRWRTDYAQGRWREVLVWFGSNDIAAGLSLETYENNVRQLVWELHQAGITNITLCSILPTSAALEKQIPPDRVNAANAWLRDYAAEAGITLWDVHALFAAPDGTLNEVYTDDGQHLNDLGYALARDVRVSVDR